MERTAYTRNAWLRHLGGHQVFNAPALLYITLFESDGSGGWDEVTSDIYERQAVTTSDPAGNVLENSNTAVFNDMPAVTVGAIGLYDASTAGNRLYFKVLDEGVEYADGDTAIFAPGDIKIVAGE